MENNPDTCPWYDDTIKEINKKIWYPTKIVDNNTFIYNFDSKVVNFNSFTPIPVLI